MGQVAAQQPAAPQQPLAAGQQAPLVRPDPRVTVARVAGITMGVAGVLMTFASIPFGIVEYCTPLDPNSVAIDCDEGGKAIMGVGIPLGVALFAAGFFIHRWSLQGPEPLTAGLGGA